VVLLVEPKQTVEVLQSICLPKVLLPLLIMLHFVVLARVQGPIGTFLGQLVGEVGLVNDHIFLHLQWLKQTLHMENWSRFKG